MAVTEEEQKVIDDKAIEDKRIADEEAAKNKTYTPEEQTAYITKLKDEQARHRIKNDELNENLKTGNDAIIALKKIEEDKLVDEGKYKELLEAKDKELLESKTDKALLERYEAVFKVDLENELKGLGDATKEMVLKSGVSVAEQLENVRAFKKEQGLNTNSPASAKAGGGAIDTKGEDAILKEYNAEKDFIKRGEMLAEIKIKFPKLYEQI